MRRIERRAAPSAPRFAKFAFRSRRFPLNAVKQRDLRKSQGAVAAPGLKFKKKALTQTLGGDDERPTPRRQLSRRCVQRVPRFLPNRSVSTTPRRRKVCVSLRSIRVRFSRETRPGFSIFSETLNPPAVSPPARSISRPSTDAPLAQTPLIIILTLEVFSTRSRLAVFPCARNEAASRRFTAPPLASKRLRGEQNDAKTNDERRCYSP